MLGVYVHLPFCPYLCPYCDFAKWPMRATARARGTSTRSTPRSSASRARRPRRSISAAERRMRTMRRRSPNCSRGCSERFPRRARGLDRNQSGARARGRSRALSARPASRGSRSACNPSNRARFKRSAASTPSKQIATVVDAARDAEMRLGLARSDVCGARADAGELATNAAASRSRWRSITSRRTA